jgi:hypothetical protein
MLVNWDKKGNLFIHSITERQIVFITNPPPKLEDQEFIYFPLLWVVLELLLSTET